MKTLSLALVVVLVICPGCSLWPTHITAVEHMPVIKSDPKPSVDFGDIVKAAQDGTLTPREGKLLDAAFEIMRYAKVRDARIEAYNTYAESRNALFDEQGEELRK